MKCPCGKQMREAHVLENAEENGKGIPGMHWGLSVAMQPFRYWVRSSRTRWTEMAVYICNGCGTIRCASTGRVKDNL